MTQSFDREVWKDRVAAWWQETAPDWSGAIARLGVNTAYGLLTASALMPLLEVYGQSPGPAMKVLVELVGGVGGNLVQGAYDKANAPQRMEQEIAENPEMRAAYETMVQKLDVLGEAQDALGAKWAEFQAELTAELQKMGGQLQIETDGGAVIFGNVEVNHGDFVARDKIINIFQVMPEPDYTPQREAYLRHVRDEAAQAPLLGVEAMPADLSRTERPSLAEVYVALDTTHMRLDKSEGEANA
jgi:hypothetical protein